MPSRPSLHAWRHGAMNPAERVRIRNIMPIRSAPPMKWAHDPNLRKRPRTPAKGRGSVQRAIRRAFAASGTEALTSSAIYDWAHIRRRLGPPQVDAVRCLFANAADAPGDV